MDFNKKGMQKQNNDNSNGFSRKLQPPAMNKERISGGRREM
jgi:hypothetical protein